MGICGHPKAQAVIGSFSWASRSFSELLWAFLADVAFATGSIHFGSREFRAHVLSLDHQGLAWVLSQVPSCRNSPSPPPFSQINKGPLTSEVMWNPLVTECVSFATILHLFQHRLHICKIYIISLNSWTPTTEFHPACQNRQETSFDSSLAFEMSFTSSAKRAALPSINSDTKSHAAGWESFAIRMARDTGSGAEVSAIKAWKEMQPKESNDPQACSLVLEVKILWSLQIQERNGWTLQILYLRPRAMDES